MGAGATRRPDWPYIAGMKIKVNATNNNERTIFIFPNSIDVVNQWFDARHIKKDRPYPKIIVHMVETLKPNIISTTPQPVAFSQNG